MKSSKSDICFLYYNTNISKFQIAQPRDPPNSTGGSIDLKLHFDIVQVHVLCKHC